MHSPCRWLPLCLLVYASSAVVAADNDESMLQRGRKIYAQSCADCHGATGDGVEGSHAQPLVGDLSIGELAAVIGRTMPEGQPEQCVGDDAQAVATFLHQAFYSPAAQVRNRPPSISMARLTSRQLQQSLADLYAAFEGVVQPEEHRGVAGEYFTGEQRKRENRKIERKDATIDFDFGDAGPGSDINAKSFLIHWRGGIKADRDGVYEIVVRSTCSFVLDFGAGDREFINNHVQSGDKTEFRRRIRLSSGRVYPFELELRQRKRKTEQPPARIQVAWIPPDGVEQVIPRRNLIPTQSPGTFALQAELPPDDRSYGYERGISVSRQWDEATTEAALEFAQIAQQELWPRYRRRNRAQPDENRAQLREFLAELATLAFRSPLSDEVRQIYVDRQVDAEPDDGVAIERSLLLVLKSPRFQFPTADSDHSRSERVASRLALFLFDSLPADRWLTRKVGEGRLEKENDVRAVARRMVQDYRVQGKIRTLFYEWLNLGGYSELSKDPERFADFDEELISDLRASLDAQLDEVVWDKASDFRHLFLSDWGYTTNRIQAFYGDAWAAVESDDGQGLQRSVSSADRQYGVVTHPYLMARLAYHDSTSPIHRGVFLIRHILGRTLRPPADAFTPINPELHPDLTTRERVSLQTSPANCQVCHERINGLGFTLENFDAVGRYRDKELEKPINSLGKYVDRSGKQVSFEGPHSLARYLAESRESQEAFVQHAFQHLVKQPVAAYGPETLQQLTDEFAKQNFNMQSLFVEIAVLAAMTQNEALELGVQ